LGCLSRLLALSFTEQSGCSRVHVLHNHLMAFFFSFFGGNIIPKYRRILKLRGDLGDLCPQLSQVIIALMVRPCWTSIKRQHQSRIGPSAQQAFPEQEAPPRPAGMRWTTAVTRSGHAERRPMFRFN